jgi:hypothetical protein
MDRKKRLAYLASEDKGVDTPLDKKLTINFESGLPIIHIDSTTVENFTVKTITNTALADEVNDLPIKLLDPTYRIPDEANPGEEKYDTRYVFISKFTIPMTRNVIIIYYEKKYKDFIIIPDLRFYIDGFGKSANVINGTLIGYQDKTDKQAVIAKTTIKEDDAITIVTEAKNIETKTHLMLINSFEKTTGINNVNIGVSADGSAEYNEIPSEATIVLELGTAEQVFTKTTKLPVYLLRQVSVEKHNLLAAGTQDMKSKKLFVTLKF